jgi:hypothetical protein
LGHYRVKNTPKLLTDEMHIDLCAILSNIAIRTVRRS